MHLIPVKKRNQHQCHFCGETRSVKYLVKLHTTQETVSCCNRCAAIHSDKIDFNFKGGNQK